MKETKFISEMEYLTFKQNLRNVFIKTLIGFCLGLFVSNSIDVSTPEKIMIVLMFTGMPYAWTVMPFHAFNIIGFIIKLVICLLLGWLITPIVLLYNFIQMKRYGKHVVHHVKQEETEKIENIHRENNNFDRVINAINSNNNQNLSALNSRYKTLRNRIIELQSDFAETTSSADAVANIGFGNDYLKASIVTTTNAFSHQYDEVLRLNQKIKDEHPNYSKGQYIVDEMEEHYTTMLHLQHELMKETQKALINHRDYQVATDSSSAGADESLFQGCTDKESLTKRYRSLMKIFHPDNSNGDLSMTQKIQYTYEKLLNQFQ